MRSNVKLNEPKLCQGRENNRQRLHKPEPNRNVNVLVRIRSKQSSGRQSAPTKIGKKKAEPEYARVFTCASVCVRRVFIFLCLKKVSPKRNRVPPEPKFQCHPDKKREKKSQERKFGGFFLQKHANEKICRDQQTMNKKKKKRFEKCKSRARGSKGLEEDAFGLER